MNFNKMNIILAMKKLNPRKAKIQMKINKINNKMKINKEILNNKMFNLT